MKRRAIAIDLGGTNLRCAVIDEAGTVSYSARRTTDAGQGVEAVIQRIADMVDEASKNQDLDASVAVGVAAPGPLDSELGIVRYAPNLPGWDEVPLGDRLEGLTGRSIKLGNDANLQALGEYHFGVAKDVNDLVYVALGTGFGGGVIANGQLVGGVASLGGELGHTTIDMLGPRCSCGSLGCVEAYCSGWAIARDGQALADSGRSAALAELTSERPIVARDVSEAASAGDTAALEVISMAGRALGAALGNFVNIFNPEMIVIGGGLAQIGDPLVVPAREYLRQYALSDIVASVQVRKSALAGRAGLFGAAALIFDS